MDPVAALITVVAGLAMGAINNVAGGAGVLGLMALQYACGLDLAHANPSTRLAAVCVGLFSFLGYLRSGHHVPGRVWALALLSIPGALLGSKLAVHLPDVVFRCYLLVVMIALMWQMLRRPRPGGERPHPWLAPLGCFLIGLHMGYAQVGTGFVAILVFTAAYSRDLLAVSAAKSSVVIVSSVTSVQSFWLDGMIVWMPAAWLAFGTAIGAFVASRWAVAKGSDAIRRVVIVIGTLALGDQVWHIVAG